MKNSVIRFSPFHREFMNNIMQDCARKNLSLPMLAQKIGVYPQTIYSWIHERHFPTPDHYNKLADFFGWPRFYERSIEL